MLARLEQAGALTTALDDAAAPGIATTRCSPSCCAPSCARSFPMSHRSCTGARRRGSPPAATTPARCATRPPATPADLAADLTTARWFEMMVDGQMGTLRPVLETMPRHCVEASPELALAFGGALLARGDHAGAQPYLRRAEEDEALVAPGRRAQFAACRAAMALYEGRLRGDPVAALQAARGLLERERRRSNTRAS